VSLFQRGWSALRGASPTVRGMAWMLACGVQFSLLNALSRVLSQQLEPFEVAFLRYILALPVMAPFVLRAGLARYRPNGLLGQAWRGAVHTAGLLCWFIALPFVPLAEATALGFTTPIFIMLGAILLFGEKPQAARWLAALIGLGGVLVVVAPGLSGAGNVHSLLMLAAAPLFAASFLITKAMTRRDPPQVIVLWQAVMVAAFTLPFAISGWVWPSAAQWAGFVVAALLGTGGHYCLTRAFGLAEMSATQPMKFLELVWAVLLGVLVFAETPAAETLAGAVVILGATTWIARREARAG
jgi:drug/metabolite transporter (DMT)-like permease